MPNLLKHALLLGVTFPVSILGYRAATASLGSESPAARSLVEGLDLALGASGHDLESLDVLRRDMYWLELKYVEKERLDPDAMFQAALDAVERTVPEVMFTREPNGRRLHVSIGAFTTVLLVQPVDTLDDLSQQLGPVATLLDAHLSPEVDRAEVEYTLINGALSTLDPHTVHLPPEAAKEMEVENQGEFGGLGIEIQIKDGSLTVKSPLDGTPASKVGLKAGDRIVRIEDESTINMDLSEAVAKLRGKVGTIVNIMVMRQGFSEPRPFSIKRDVISINPVEGQLLEGNVGYIRIQTFNAKVGQNVDELLARFRREARGPLRGLVLDLRDNPGGYLHQAIDVSNKFLDDGVIVATVEGGGARREESRATSRNAETDYPIVVLVNGQSASASEIVAGALRNLDRAVVVGERTFGKGSVQHLYRQNDESNLKLTVAKYLTPGDKSIQSIGIPPDILLQPSVVRPPEKPKPGEKGIVADHNPIVSLYWRQWLDREADLDHHLDRESFTEATPSYTVRYLRPPKDDEDTGSKKDPNADWEVQFSRKVLLSATGARTADVLAAARPVVEQAAKVESERITDAFSVVGLDWSPGENPATPALTAHLDLGDDGLLVAGEEEDVYLEVTNTGSVPVFRLSATTESENPWLNRREFYFGRVDPGETLRYAQRVAQPEGYGTEIAPVTITFRDQAHDDLLEVEALSKTQGHPLPRFSYSLALKDDGSGQSKGNGNGLPEPGEVVDLVVSVTNRGEGAAREGYVRLKNRSGRALDLQKGNVELGEWLDADGKSCPADSVGCSRPMAPGAAVTGRLTFELREVPESGVWDLDLMTGDNRAYDYQTIQRGGFYDFYELTEHLVLTPGQPMDGSERRPPEIEISRGPDAETTSSQLVVSGVVRDDLGLRDVLVFKGQDKVFYRGGEDGVTALPFTVDEDLSPGANTIYVLARDGQGLTSTRAIETWYDAPTAEAKVAPAPHGG